MTNIFKITKKICSLVIRSMKCNSLIKHSAEITLCKGRKRVQECQRQLRGFDALPNVSIPSQNESVIGRHI